MGTMKEEYKSQNHVKFRLSVHLIFCVKYRKKLLTKYGEDVKILCEECASDKRFKIRTMEVVKDHLHLLVDFEPSCSIGYIVKCLKSFTTQRLWKMHSDDLQKHFWKKKILWSGGYFACSVGMVSSLTIEEYIKNQG